MITFARDCRCQRAGAGWEKNSDVAFSLTASPCVHRLRTAIPTTVTSGYTVNAQLRINFGQGSIAFHSSIFIKD